MMQTCIAKTKRRQASTKSLSVSALAPRWVTSTIEASRAARSVDARAVWIVVDDNLADSIAYHAAIEDIGKKTGFLLLQGARSALLPTLWKRFKEVAFPSRLLPKEELDEVFKLSDREDRFIGGTVDKKSKTVTLWRGNFDSISVPFTAFPSTANGIHPKFDKFSVIDYGDALKFGDYESATEAVLFEYAPDFRQRLKQNHLAKEQTLGASIRRLRKQRRLTRSEFGNVDPKTLARIELGEVKSPHDSTLKQIAKVLGVPQAELSSY
jgi:Helix-turn-helix